MKNIKQNEKKSIVVFVSIIVLSMLMVSVADAGQYGEMKGTILTLDGEPFSNAQMCFYDAKSGPMPFSREYWRACDYFGRTGEDGSFAERLPAGRYYVLATKKTTGERAGPPIAAGDPTWPAWDGSELQTYIVTEEGPTDIGIVPGAVPFKKDWLPKGETAIEGRVLLKDGTPAEGVLVHASGDPKLKELVFISDMRTDTEGKYIVRVDEDGVYYLEAKGADKPIVKAVVNAGEITKDIDIVVEKNPGRRWEKKHKEK